MKKCFVWLYVLLLLSSCSIVSPTDKVIDSINSSIAAVEKSLPAECRTGGIPDQLASIKNQVAALSSTCQAEKIN